MSGGSCAFGGLNPGDPDAVFEYLFALEPTLVGAQESLAARPNAEDAASEVEELLLIMRQFRIRAQKRLDRLAPIFKALDYIAAADWGEMGMDEALAKYRGEDEAQ